MKKTNKKGFTIVELVIVIAVVAILAAVLIPTFVSVTKRANESKDTQLVRNLNTALAVDTEVGKHETMQSALEAAAKAGYDVAKINTSATDNEILWDSKNDCFVYKKDSGIEYIPNSKTEEATADDLWKIVNDAAAAAANKTYNSYIKGTAELGDMTVETGVDVGENTLNGTVTYQNSGDKNVVVRTNGGTFVVDAINATVKHYGKADKVTITAVAPKSYHEYGEVVGNIELANGRVVMEAGSKASAIKVTATKDSVDKGAVVSVDTTASAVSVVVPADVKTAIENKEGNGITASEDKIITDDTVISNMDKFAGGLGTEESPYLIATAEQFVKIGDFSEEMGKDSKYFFKLISDIDLRTYTNFNKFGEAESYAVSGYFNGGLDGAKGDGTNYKLISNDTLNYVFESSFNSSNFSNIDYYYVDTFVSLCPGQSGNTTTVFDNVDMYMVEENSSIQFERNQGLYSNWIALDVCKQAWSRNNDVIVKNADVYVNIIGVEYNAVFFGGAPYFGGSGTVVDSTYYGSYYGEAVNLVLGNPAHSSDYTLTVTNVKNKGILAATQGNPMIAGGNYSSATKEDKFGIFTNVDLGVSRYLYDSNLDIENNDNGLKIKEAASESTAYYVLTISGGTRLTSSVSENSVYTFRVVIEKEKFVNKEYQTNFKGTKMATVAQYKEFVDANATFDSSNAIKVYGENNAEFWMVEKDGITYYVFDFHDNGEKYFITKPNKVVTSSVVAINGATIMACDSEGLPIAQKTIKLK